MNLEDILEYLKVAVVVGRDLEQDLLVGSE